MSKQFSFIVISFFVFFNQNVFSQNCNPCLTIQQYRIVVLGSSTAAGAGVSSSDSAWVNRYRNYLQVINPNNEVINLAVGGYTSYKLMPTEFVPPSGRPSPDTSKNITTAINLLPDAIIVNLPSNDIASGFSLEEQIANLDSISQHANSNGIPIWFSTTQPRNMSIAKRLLQAQMRDSINVHFGAFAIDFWTGFALSDNSIDPIFDSGDGIHFNDTAHDVLCSRVDEADLLSFLFTPSTIADYGMINLTHDVGACGNPNAIFEVVLTNIGANDFGVTDICFELRNEGGALISTAYQQVNNGLNTCETDTVLFVADLSLSGNYVATVFSENQNDTNLVNDTLVKEFSVLGIPLVQIAHDTLCEPGLAYLEIEHEPGDTAFWYSAPMGGSFIHAGEIYQPGWVDSSSVWYAEVARGDLFYRGDIFTTAQSNINWNGVMFDLVASQTLTIDSIDIKIATIGWQQIEIYSKTGSYIGFELDTTPWSLVDTVSAFVTSTNEFTSFVIDSFLLPAVDTVGIYIQMTTSTSRLSYQSVSSFTTRSNSEISMISGTGIGHNWASMYPHRDLNCQIYYHYGFNPLGTCSTGRLPVYAFLSDTALSLGPDTLLDLDSSLVLSALGFSNYLWSDGSTSSSFNLVASDYGLGFHEFWLSALDPYNCSYSDTILVEIVDVQTMPWQEQENTLILSPNPSKGLVNVSLQEGQSLSVYNAQGRNVYHSQESGGQDLRQFSKGIYLFVIKEKNSIVFTQKVVLE